MRCQRKTKAYHFTAKNVSIITGSTKILVEGSFNANQK